METFLKRFHQIFTSKCIFNGRTGQFLIKFNKNSLKYNSINLELK